MKNALATKKRVFTFTVEGAKHEFDTVTEMWVAIRTLRADGANVDNYSIKREWIG